jgi:hypothetical protein
MLSWELLPATLVLAFVVTAAGVSILACGHLSRSPQRQSSFPINNLYADKDGSATVESQRAFSSCKLQCALLWLSSLATTSLALASALLETTTVTDRDSTVLAAAWLNFSASVSYCYRH